MDILDLLLAPLYLFIFFLLAKRTIGKNSNNFLYGRYYMRGMIAKMGAVITFALIYIYYYKGGDSLAFYYSTSPVYKLLFYRPDLFINFVLNPTTFYPSECLYEADQHGVMYLVRGSATLTTIRIAAIVDLVCFNSYIVLCMVFAYISYLAQWRFFKLMAEIYPSLHKQLSWVILFIPSVLFWGSGLGKDSIMLSSILLIFTCIYNISIKKNNILKNFIFFICSAYIISLVRGFLLYAMVPCIILMLISHYRNMVNNTLLRILAGPILLVVGVGASFVFIQSLGSSVESYSMDSLQQKAEGFHSWHSYLGETQGGSSYSLGENIEYTPMGILRQAPLAIAIALYGPFIWQVRNPVMLMSALESLVFLMFTLRILINKKVYKLIQALLKDHILAFSIPFTLILAVAIGITSFNYGALVRYRIPILPFLGLTLVISYHYFYQTSENDTP